MTDVEVNWDNQVSGTEDLFLFKLAEGATMPQAQHNPLLLRPHGDTGSSW